MRFRRVIPSVFPLPYAISAEVPLVVHLPMNHSGTGISNIVDVIPYVGV